MDFSFVYDGNVYTGKDLQTKDNKSIVDLGNGVVAEAKIKEIPEYNAEEWVLYFKNSGSSNSKMFSEINDCDTEVVLKNPEKKRLCYVTNEGFPCITSMRGCVDRKNYDNSDKGSADEFGLCDDYIYEEETKTYQNRGARSSDILMPFFDLHSGDSGVMTAIGWSGGWRIKFERKDEKVRIVAGLKKTNFYLKPGEEIRTSSVLLMKYEGEDKYNKFRRLIKNHYSYKAHYPYKQESVLSYMLWGELPSNKMIERINQMKEHDIKFDTVWIDAMWFSKSDKAEEHKDGWGEYNGNWTVNTEIHPGKLYDVKEAVKEAGCELLLWCEPEYPAWKDVPVLREHPEWFTVLKDEFLYYGNDKAYSYVKNILCEMIEALDLVCYRQDFTHCPMEYFEKLDEEGRCGISEIKHITAMYRLWDELLIKYPKLIIDNCASGGRRIDIETLKRSVPLFRTDYQCNYNPKAEVFQVHNAGISNFIPYNGCTAHFKNDIYGMRSTYSSCWAFDGYGTASKSMEEADFAAVKKCVDEYREIREYFTCDFYNHASSVYDDSAWTIFEYCDSDKKEGIIMAFRRCGSPHACATISLCTAAEGKKIAYTNLDTGKEEKGSRELKISLPERRSSVIYKYKVL